MRRPFGLACVVLLTVVAALPLQANEICSLGDTALFATNSIFINRDSTVTGDVVVNEASPGPTLAVGFEAFVNQGTTVFGAVKADSVRLSKGVQVGTVVANEVVPGTATIGSLITPLALPVFESVPPFIEPTFRFTPVDVFVGPGVTTILDEGDYGVIEIAGGGTLLLSGGIYNVGSIVGVGVASSILFQAATEVRVLEGLSLGRSAVVAPAPGAVVGAADVLLYVAGTNAIPGDPSSVPSAVGFGQGSHVEANLYAVNGTIRVDQASQVTGSLYARDIFVDKGSTVVAASAFRNRAPTAEADSFYTSGALSIEITLRGSDPEFQSLVFAIASGPTAGVLGEITPIVPDPVEDPPSSGEFVQPPVTSATVVYTPNTPDDLEDSFTFSVTDPCGAYGMAPVEINPPGDPTPGPPPLETVEARDQSVETLVDRELTIVLRAAAPAEVDLEFTIASDPAFGQVTHPPDPGSEDPTRSASVVYTPNSDFTGTDSFTFEACPPIGSTLVCDQGVVTVTVSEPPPLAVDQELSVQTGGLAKIDLGGGVPGSSLRSAPAIPTKVDLRPKAAFLAPATVAGNVADGDGDGFGDSHDPLPGPAPVLVAAGVDVNLGAVTSGSVGDPAGDAADDSRVDPDPDLLSATASSDGANLDLQVRFAPGTFDAALSRAEFVLDTDQDPSTGFPGVDEANNDSNLMGLEFLVDIGADLGANAEVLKFVALPNVFEIVGTVPATVVANGYDVSVPLSLLDNDDGALAFKVLTQSYLGGGFTAILDYMPNLGLAPGVVGSAQFVQGVARIQIEWDLAFFASTPPDQLESAQVILETVKGTVDSLDTFFFVGGEEQDGLLTDPDFEAPAEVIPGVVMPVPDVPPGTEGTFSFDVTTEMRTFLETNATVFSIQGRVDESLAGQGFERGLQIRSTADGNVQGFREPKLSLATPGVIAPTRAFSLLSLPSNGVLFDPFGSPIVEPTTLFSSKLTYVSNGGFQGTDSFQFQVTDLISGSVGTAIITLFVVDTCADTGRPPGCSSVLPD